MNLQKDHDNKMLFGVCSGICKSLEIDPLLVRLGFVIATLMGFGLPVVIYIILAIVMK